MADTPNIGRRFLKLFRDFLDVLIDVGLQPFDAVLDAAGFPHTGILTMLLISVKGDKRVRSWE